MSPLRRGVSTVSDGLYLCYHGENRSSNHGRDTVLARSLEPGIRRTGTVTRDSVFDRYTILVTLRICVARVPHEKALWDQAELERFVLCTFSDATRELESSQGMLS